MGIMKTLTINGETFNLTPVVPTSSVILLASAWVGNGDTYSQVVGLPGVSLNTKVDLQPTPEQLEEFHYLTLGFVAENEGGIVTVYAIGDKPTNDHTIQVTLTEVEAEGKIRGNTVGTTIPRADWNQEDPTKADFIKNKPNINDQTPTFEQAPASENIVSGEKLSTIFGKVMRAISDQASHYGNNTNPHSVTAEQVGARPNTWMPTAADVGAAPAGFGLGETVKWIFAPETLADYIHSGFYSWSSGVSDAPFYAGSMIVIKRSAEYAFQVAFRDDITRTEMAVRKLTVTTWTPWEWINPPMAFGTEYRTTKKYNGKPVYTKVIKHTLTEDVGNTSGATNLQINGGAASNTVDSIVSVTAVYTNTSGVKFPIPAMSGGGTVYLGINRVAPGNLIVPIVVYKDVLQAGAYLEIIYEYTKTTD